VDLFEKLGKRISDLGNSVAQNTKNFADTAGLQKANSDNKKKIEQLYAAIGKAYYEKHKNDPAAEEIASINEITALFAQIEENDEKIKQLKGVTKCENCGADVPSDSMFCNNCGTKVVKPVAAPAAEAAPASNQRLCPTCGQPVGQDNMFCNNCGAKL
jgi:predicted nucleic acid-binding Zn ribbon protein